MTLKETVDKYLTDNFKNIEKLRNLSGFSWNGILKEIEEQESLVGELFTLYENGQYDKSDREYVRSRFTTLRSKAEDWASKILQGNREVIKNQVKEDFENLLIKGCSSTTLEGKFKFFSGKEDKEKGTKEFHFTADNIPDESEIVEHFNIDLSKYKISQIWHKTTPSGKYSISVNLQALRGAEAIQIPQEFIDKINTLAQHTVSLSNHLDKNKPLASLLIPKQDAHWNKRDINGKNSIEDRFKVFTQTLLEQLEKVIKTNSLEKITYIIGSDEFNSEWTGQTTHGTPQSNILTYQQSFEKISEFNIETIKLLRFYAPKVEVILLNGNHDHNVGWHLATLLKQVFKKNESVEVNDSIDNTKVVSFHSTLVLLNHGDAVKPKDLAAKFPIIAKDIWSNYSNYTVICGDKHHEMSHDFHGTMFYQVPQLSTAKSDWDDKKGFITSKAELLLFLFEEDGLSNILRKQIK